MTYAATCLPVRAALLLGFALAALPARARAEQPMEAVGIAYAAPPACPPEEAFVAAVRTHTIAWRPARDGEPARRFVVEVEAIGARLRGRLALAGESPPREVDGDTCDEVVAALALMTALAIDPHASLVPTPPPVPTVTAEPAPSAPPEGPPAAAPPPVAPPSEPRPWGWNLGLQATSSSGQSPSWMFGGRVFAAAERRGGRWPSARLWLAAAASPPESTPFGTAHFARALTGVDLCPIAWRLGPLLAAPCGRVAAGALWAWGSDVPLPRHERRAWLDLGALGHFAWEVGARVSVEVDGGASFPMLRDRFEFPQGLVYVVPAVGAFVGAGAAWRFP